MTFLIEAVVSVLLLIGGFFGLMGSLGLVRLPDFFCRLHAPTKASTLGVGATLLGALLLPLAYGRAPGFVELLLTLFVFISAPVSANMLSLAAIRTAGRDPITGEPLPSTVADVEDIAEHGPRSSRDDASAARPPGVQGDPAR